jgi:aminopeptidase YwaD
MLRGACFGVVRAGLCVLAPALLVPAVPARGQASPPPPLLPEQAVRALAAELSGTEARHTLQDLTLFHRMRGSRGFKAASDRIAERARSYGLAVEVISLPADGKAVYGTQRSRPAWDAEFAELWEQRHVFEGAEGAAGAWADADRIASWEARPITLAEDSATGQVAADLVDIGQGSTEKDYAGKDVRGKLVLAAAQPGQVAALAVGRFGAAGIVSYAQNQPTAWSREDENLVRWGHLETFAAPRTFAFMISLKQARAWQERLAAGGAVHLHATVIAAQHAGSYDIVTATIPGLDGVGGGGHAAGEEVVLSCHLDHQRPGANDNASGCATILEVARTLAKLVRDGKLPRPRRTLRFLWPPEVEGTIALLNARPDLAKRARAVIHMDMVGGEAGVTGAVFHVTRSPKSLPTFVNDVGEAFGRFVDAQSDAFASTGSAAYPLADPEGSKRALQAEIVDFTPGSDHEVWSEGSFRVPAIYLNDWPDRYIHTHADSVANIDPTKLLRAGFIGAASAWYLAQLDGTQVPALWEEVRRHALERTAQALGRAAELRAAGSSGSSGSAESADSRNRDAAALLRFHLAYEQGVIESIAGFADVPPATRQAAAAFLASLRQLTAPPPGAPAANRGAAGDGNAVLHRSADPKGPMTGFGYSYFEDRREAQKIAVPALSRRQGLWGSEYTYEALNLVDGRRSVRDIRDALTAIYGPVPLAEVAEYLEDLRRIGVLAAAAP